MYSVNVIIDISNLISIIRNIKYYVVEVEVVTPTKVFHDVTLCLLLNNSLNTLCRRYWLTVNHENQVLIVVIGI